MCVDPNLMDISWRTPLIRATEKGHKDVVEMLIKAGALKDCKDCYQLTALSYAQRKGHEAIVNLLRDNNTKATDSKGHDLQSWAF